MVWKAASEMVQINGRSMADQWWQVPLHSWLIQRPDESGAEPMVASRSAREKVEDLSWDQP